MNICAFTSSGAWGCGLCTDVSILRIEQEMTRYVVVNGERKRKSPGGLLPEEIRVSNSYASLLQIIFNSGNDISSVATAVIFAALYIEYSAR